MITEKEFDKIIDEVIYQKPPRYDTLLEVARRILYPTVKRWCYNDLSLRRHQELDDVMSEICIRIMTTCVTCFFLRDDLPDGETLNRDRVGLVKWMFVVARHKKCDIAHDLRSVDLRSTSIDDRELRSLEAPDPELERERIKRLSKAFSIVLDSDASIYKVLTWLAVILFMIHLDMTKIDSTSKIVEEFSDKPLNELWSVILGYSEEIEWVRITKSQRARIESALKKRNKDGRTFGETPFRNFFMKKGGKGSVSDWMNRINTHVRAEIKDGTSYC